MEKQTVIVTGASRGLGAAVARIAGKMGANVVLVGRTVERMEEEARAIQAARGSAFALSGDVSREADCQAVIERTLERLGAVDALVNNAGVVEPIAPLAEADVKAWEQNWAVNVLGPLMLTRLALPSLRERGGRVINISSGAAENVVGGWGAYSTAKAALNHFTHILASEEPAITAIALLPGIVDTEMQATIREKGKGRMAERNYAYLSGMHEQGKLLSPDLPGLATACLALYAPRDWSGQVMRWDDERVQELVKTRGF